MKYFAGERGGGDSTRAERQPGGSLVGCGVISKETPKQSVVRLKNSRKKISLTWEAGKKMPF